MDKLTMAHEWALVFTQHNKDLSVAAKTVSAWAFDYADAMQAELDKRNKAEAEQKRKEVREMLNAPNTFVEREGQHFDDVEEWQPDWSQAPEWANYWVMNYNGICYWTESQPVKKWDKYAIVKNERASTFNYQGEWQNSLRERPL